MLSINAGRITGLTAMGIRRTTQTPITRTAIRSRTTQAGITRTDIHSLTSRIGTHTPGQTRAVLITTTGTAIGIVTIEPERESC